MKIERKSNQIIYIYIFFLIYLFIKISIFLKNLNNQT